MGLRTISALSICLALCIAGATIRADEKDDLGALFNQARNLHLKAEFRRAAPLYERAAAIAPRIWGPADSGTATVYNNLAMVYTSLGRYAEAEELFTKALALREAALGKQDLEVAATLNDAGNLFMHLNRLEQAEAYHKRSQAIRESKLGPDVPLVAESLSNLSNVYRKAGRFAEAEPLCLRSLKIFETQLGADHPSVAAGLNNLANVYDEMGRYAEAERLYERALKIRETELGAEHPDVAQALSNLAAAYRETGKFARAEPLFQRALKIREQTLGPDHPDVAETLSNLANLELELGRYTRAETFYARVLQIREAKLGPDHPEVARALQSRADVLQALKQPAEAEKFYQRALAIKEAKLGPDHPSVAACLFSLGCLYDNYRRGIEAEPLYRRCLKIRETKLGLEHPDTAAAVHHLAACLEDLGKRDEAEPLYARSVQIGEATLGPDHPDLVTFGLHSQARLFATRGDLARSADVFERTRRIMRRHIARTLPMLTDREQLAFLERMDRPRLETALSLAVRNPTAAGLAEKSAGWLANGKGVAQVALTERARLARDARDPQLTKAAERLLAVRSELASLAIATPIQAQSAVRTARVAALTAEESTLGRQLAPTGSTWDDDPWVALDAIRTALPPDAVLLDFARLKVRQFVDSQPGAAEQPLVPHYAAWIVPRAGAGEVRVVDLGAERDINQAVAAYQVAVKEATGDALRTHGEAEAERRFTRPLAELSRLVLAPLRPHLGDAKELILSPDAGLWLIPWAALPDGDGKYLVENRRLRFVIAGRELAAKPPAGGPTPGAARILADPDYGQMPANALAAFRSIVPNPQPSAAPIPTGTESLALRSATAIGRVERLPFTEVEASLVAPHLKTLTQLEPKVYLHGRAQESILKLIRNPRVLLLSTHGYFLPDQQTGAADGKTTMRETTGGLSENPLLRCGLLLAGCNERDKYTDPTLGDGVMTGLEIVGCDFRGTELVVLSACETGLGQVNNGEGVAGLRQAFQLAGAHSVVSTLWQIPDKQSAVLMNDFFTNLAAGQSKAEALRNAQLAMIQSRREKLGAAHPLFWAAWTVTGN